MKNRIAFDFDGVIADTSKAKREWLLINKNINILNVDKSSFFCELTKKYPYDYVKRLYLEMSMNIFNKDVLFETIPIKDSIQSIKRLSFYYDIFIISARPKDDIILIKEWLNKYGIHNEITGILSSSHEKKIELCKKNDICLLCDDDIRHLEKSNDIYLIHFNTNNYYHYNSFDHINYLSSWNDIERGLMCMNNEIVTFIGGPASGKSTRMDYFRDYEIVSSSKLLLDAGYNLSTGDLISDSDVANLILEKVNSLGNKKVILDGFPRTIKQYESLKKNNIHLSKVYFIDTPDEEMIRRAQDRLTCIKCHSSFTKSDFKPPIHPYICDKCNSILISRPDDSYDIMLKKINLFKEKTLPLIDYFLRDNVCLIRIDGFSPIDVITDSNNKELILK